VCVPCIVASRVVSRHHWYIHKEVRRALALKVFIKVVCIISTRLDVNKKAEIAPITGQGLRSTIWKE